MDNTHVYISYQILDEYGRRQLIAVSKSKNVAKEIAKGRGWWGGDGEVDGPFNLCSTLEDYKLDTELQVRVKAFLAKLTPKEKTALGLPNE